jgi:3D (Asp-Asp-Asp) domain-containing protein
VRGRRESRLALVLALALALGLSVSLAGARGAGTLGEQQRVLQSKSHAALLGLYALDAQLANARSELARLRARAEALRSEEQQVRKEIAIVESNLRVSQRVLGTHLRTLYENGEPDAIAVLLGSTSLDDAVTRLNELEQAARQGANAVTASQEGKDKLTALADQLAARAREARDLAARAERTTAALERARAQRVAYIASLAQARKLKARQISALETRAARYVERSQAIQHGAAPALPAVAGAQTLTVTATGYSLPGRTATGMPVGAGVVAVDPSVIPLGTRMTIPGYGEGVAADTGGAVSGYVIDLWFPTLADALAWGRRTVTITLH